MFWNFSTCTEEFLTHSNNGGSDPVTPQIGKGILYLNLETKQSKHPNDKNRKCSGVASFSFWVASKRTFLNNRNIAVRKGDDSLDKMLATKLWKLKFESPDPNTGVVVVALFNSSIPCENELQQDERQRHLNPQISNPSDIQWCKKPCTTPQQGRVQRLSTEVISWPLTHSVVHAHPTTHTHTSTHTYHMNYDT